VSGECVTDNLTGLVWPKNAYIGGGAMTSQQALDFANNLTLCGHSDWRVPNVKELESLLDYSHYDLALPSDHPFTNVACSRSSTTIPGSTTGTIDINIIIGARTDWGKTSPTFVWPVRAGQVAVTGQCGSANSGAFTTVPTSNLCTAGTPSAVSGSGPWTWTCAGSNGGSAASCSALFSFGLYADFGSSGTWLYNGSYWSKLTSSNPENMVASGSLLYADFGSDGTWLYNGSNWGNLTSSNPTKMVASGSLLYADFNPYGIWLYNGSNWNKLTSSNPETWYFQGRSSTLTSEYRVVSGYGTAATGASLPRQTRRTCSHPKLWHSNGARRIGAEGHTSALS